MRTRVVAWVAAFLATVASASLLFAAAQAASENPRSDASFADNSYTVRLPLKDRNLVTKLVERNIEILAVVRGGYIDVLVEPKDLDFVMTLGQPISVIREPGMMGPGATALDPNLGIYHTYLEMVTALGTLETTYPTLADRFIIGPTIESRNMYVLKISDNVTVDEDEPEVLFMGNHHAREIMTVEIPIKFAEYLLANYGVIPEVTQLVNSREIFLIPMVNPDGHAYVEANHTGSSDYWWRKNRRYNYDGSYGVDLNRNYGYMWGYDNTGSSPTPSSDIYRGTGPFSEPEIQAIRTFCNGRHFTLSMSFHSYGELFLYPWGYAPLHTPDHELFVALGDTLTSANGYQAGTSPEVLYAVNGDTDDWAYGETFEKNKIFAFTAEMNSSAQGGFAPAEALIQPTFNLLLPMNMDILRFADNPYRVMPPARPTQYAIDEGEYPFYKLIWSAGSPSDPNPPVSYDVVEYKNLGFLAQDPANTTSPLWTYNGFTVSTARQYEGTGSYFSGAVNNASRTLEASTFYAVAAESDSLRARVWYNIETNWDYAYFEKSTDGGRTWQTVPGNITTNSNPNGNNRGNGITGSSPGWVLAIFPLTSALGEELQVRFSYVTDQSVLGEGIYIDLPGPVPMYEARTLIASAIPDTTLAVTPQQEARFSYQVRARDGENQASLWSFSQSITIENVTAIGRTTVLANRLGAAYPNPFNPSTTIPYTVGAAGGAGRPVHVTLAVYNVAGARVATLVDGEIPPGAYEAVWKSNGDRGESLSSGVYFARLTVGNGQALTRKLVLLK